MYVYKCVHKTRFGLGLRVGGTFTGTKSRSETPTWPCRMESLWPWCRYSTIKRVYPRSRFKNVIYGYETCSRVDTTYGQRLRRDLDVCGRKGKSRRVDKVLIWQSTSGTYDNDYTVTFGDTGSVIESTDLSIRHRIRTPTRLWHVRIRQ